jgi:cell division protein FtsZ
LITTPGLINLDFADVKSVMSGAGSALMGIGSSRGDDRAVAAAEMAISSPLLEASIDGAHGVLLSIQGGSDLGLFEINEAAQLVANSAAPDANIIFGAVIDDALGDEVRVTVIAAGFDEAQAGPARSTRQATPYQLNHGQESFGAPWRPVTLPSLRDSQPGSLPAVSADSPSAPLAVQPAREADAKPGTDTDPGGSSAPVPPPRSADDGWGAGERSNGQSPPRDPPPVLRGDGHTTRRRSVVFEEDDELDVPDFLK